MTKNTDTMFPVGTTVFYKDGKQVVEARVVEAIYYSDWDNDSEFTGDYWIKPVNLESCYRYASVQNEDDISTDKKVILQRILDEIHEEQELLNKLSDKVLAELIQETNNE